MSEITNKAAYLKGLADGLKLDTETTEGNLLSQIIDLLGDVADEIEALDEEQAYIEDKMDEMEDVIEVIGNEAFGCDYDDEEDGVYTLSCDKCGAEIDFTDEDLDDIASGAFVCPECGADIELDFEECDCCDCDCDDCK